MKITRFIICLLLVVFVSGFGCTSSKPSPDPLAGWQADFKQPDQSIEKDYQDYIQTLSSNEKPYVQVIQYLKDGNGQHAVVIEVDLKPNAWNHVLIYDKDNKRAKVMKYIDHQFRS